MILTKQQQDVLQKIQNFLTESDAGDIFILKGYAGTGKSTLVRFIADFLEKQKISYEVAAPTGKAAKVLKDKLGKGVTIHRIIYSKTLCCLKVNEEDVSKKEYHYFFPVLQLGGSNNFVLIVDEASMISDMKNELELMTFGTGRLLSDLLTYMQGNGVRKILFIGDPAQLPPVTDSKSRAMDAEYLRSMGYKVTEAALTEVMRQEGNSGVAELSMEIRDKLSILQKQRNELVLKANGVDVFDETPDSFLNTFMERYSNPEYSNAVMIAYSNRQCLLLNDAARQVLFPGQKDVQVNDVLVIGNNVYNVYPRDIFNGDVVRVVDVGRVETRNIPVFFNGAKEYVTLQFREVSVLYPGDMKEFVCKIHDGMLSDPERDLSLLYQKALYIDFCIRWNNEHPGLDPRYREGGELFIEALSKDLYFNALKVKYGYAITCHKAQGSEWDCVFVDYTGKNGLSDSALRWSYTATTRARKRLYMLNAPHINGFTKLSFLPVKRVTKSCADFFSPSVRPDCPDCPAGVPIGVALKYEEIRNKLRHTGFVWTGSESFPYRERFHFQLRNGTEVLMDASYDKNGIFKKFAETGCEEQKELVRLLNTPYIYPVHVKYEPSTKVLDSLFQQMQTACVEADAVIVQIKEMLSQYFVFYGLKTDADFAYIQFFVTENGALSTAIPMSADGPEDKKLVQIIHFMLGEDVV